MKLIIQILLMLYSVGLSSQTEQTIVTLNILSKVERDGIKLRWAIDDPHIWQLALSKGYTLERAEYIEGTLVELLDYIPIDPNITRIENKEWLEYESQVPINDNSHDSIKYAHISRALSEEDSYLTGEETFAEQMAYKNALETKFVYALLAADLSWKGAIVQGLGYLDRDVKEGEKYSYRLSLNFEETGYEVPFSYHTVLNMVSDKPYEKELSIVERDSELNISWENQRGINGANIEYSVDGKFFLRDNTSPYFQLNASPTKDLDSLSYTIDSLSNYTLYTIRVFGKTPFGDEEFIGEIKGMPRDKTAPNRPTMLGVKQQSPESAIIQWKMIQPLPKDLKGYIIGRGNADFGEFYRIHEGVIPPSWTAFEDKYFDLDTSNYYIVEAIDTSGNISRSNSAYLTLVDSIPPKAPLPISGIMDSMGIVTLKLEPQIERDFMGYRIYKSNDPDHEFSVVHETYNDTIVANARNPILTDTSTLESLTPYLYYYITALDYHYNESNFSDTIKVPRPDKYPPVPPLITGFNVSEKGVVLNVISSTSVDVVNNYIYRKESDSYEWKLIDSLGLIDTTYIVADVEGSGNRYDYAMTAKDNSNLESDFGNVLNVKHLSRPKSLDLGLTCNYYSQNKTVLLQWTLSEYANSRIYHSVEDVSTSKNYGVSPYSNGYLWTTELPPTSIIIKSRTQSKEFLPYEFDGCEVIKEDISISDIRAKLKSIQSF